MRRTVDEDAGGVEDEGGRGLVGEVQPRSSGDGNNAKSGRGDVEPNIAVDGDISTRSNAAVGLAPKRAALGTPSDPAIRGRIATREAGDRTVDVGQAACAASSRPARQQRTTRRMARPANNGLTRPRCAARIQSAPSPIRKQARPPSFEPSDARETGCFCNLAVFIAYSGAFGGLVFKQGWCERRRGRGS